MSLRKKVLETANEKKLFTISDVPHHHRGETLGSLLELEDEGIAPRIGYVLDGQIWLMSETDEWFGLNVKPEGAEAVWCETGHDYNVYDYFWHGFEKS